MSLRIGIVFNMCSAYSAFNICSACPLIRLLVVDCMLVGWLGFQADSLSVRDPDTLNIYQERERKIADLKERLAGETDQLENGEGKIDEVKNRWLPELKQVSARSGTQSQEGRQYIPGVGANHRSGTQSQGRGGYEGSLV